MVEIVRATHLLDVIALSSLPPPCAVRDFAVDTAQLLIGSCLDQLESHTEGCGNASTLEANLDQEHNQTGFSKTI